MFKRWKFEDIRSDEIEPKDSKRQQLDTHGDKEEKDLDKFESEGEAEDKGYISLFFVAFFRKKSNRPTDMGEETRSLNYLISIPKICQSYKCLVCVRVPR